MNRMKGSRPNRNDKTNAILTGIFFIMATTTAIAGLILYDPALIGDNNFITIAENRQRISSGAFFELLLVCSNIGTGIMLFPYLKRFNERLGLGYIFFRFLESVLILVGLVSVLALSSLASHYTIHNNTNPAGFHSEAMVLKAIHDWTFILGPHFVLGINTFIYSYVFLKSNLVPRQLAMMGLSGAVLIFIAANLELFGIIRVNDALIIIMALPIALYEMILAAWLIVKGFNFKTDEIRI